MPIVRVPVFRLSLSLSRQPDNITIAVTARLAGPDRLAELNAAAATSGFGPASGAAEAGNVSVVLSAQHRVLPAEHAGWGHWALSLNNETEQTRCLERFAALERQLGGVGAAGRQPAVLGHVNVAYVRRVAAAAGSEAEAGAVVAEVATVGRVAR